MTPSALERSMLYSTLILNPPPPRGPDDWPCPRCGLIGCDHDDGLPEYRGAFDTEGRH